ncbi:MAG: hypothetical protein ACI828_000610 [Flavobacteriales bacterium]|jgi:hypothetical protein
MTFNIKHLLTLGLSTLLLMPLVSSCAKEQKESNKKNTHAFLLGTWERTNEQEGQNTYEIWNKSGKEYTGIGYTMRAGDTIFKEQMRLYIQDTIWTLEVSGVNKNPTPFRLTSFTSHSFVAENPQNEFPKMIEYRYFDDTITATISDEETEIPFIFWRIED